MADLKPCPGCGVLLTPALADAIGQPGRDESCPRIAATPKVIAEVSAALEFGAAAVQRAVISLAAMHVASEQRKQAAAAVQSARPLTRRERQIVRRFESTPGAFE